MRRKEKAATMSFGAPIWFSRAFGEPPPVTEADTV